MNPVQRALRTVAVGWKSLVMRWSGSRSSWAWGSGALRSSRFDEASQINAGASPLIAAAVLWLGRTLPEAPIRVRRRVRDGALEVRDDHPLTVLLNRPNPYYSGLLLWQATIADWMIGGNAYWLKVRSGANRVVELWWVPSSTMTPKFPDDGSAFLTHWEYNPGGTPIRVETSDVVHFRYGLDPLNPRLGLSPIASLARELYSDEMAAAWTSSLLRNAASGMVVIAPADDHTTVTPEDAEGIKSQFEHKTTGDNRGRPVVMSANVKVTSLSFNPQQMVLRDLRQVSEERVASVIGIPAIVLGFGAGLARSTFANYAESREAAYEGFIIPAQRLFAAELTTQLLPDLGAAGEVLDFDTSEVRVLQPDLDKLYARLDIAVRGGWMMPDEAREVVGLDALPAGGKVLYVPVSAVPTPPEEIGVAPEPLELPEPTPMRALPPPEKSRRPAETKASAQNFADGLTRIRDRHQGPCERELGRFLEAQRGRVIASLNTQGKAIGWAEVFAVLSEEKALRAVLEKWYRRVLGSVHELGQDAVGTSFDLDDPATRRVLADCGAQIRGITTTTRDAIAKALQDGQALGEGIPDLARRIEALTEFKRPRATMIARTELGASSNISAIEVYESSGLVVGVRVFDGHDDEPCRSLNGRTMTLAEARKLPPLSHPNCTRALGGVVDAAEMESAA